jgi:serine protease Do
MCRSIFVFILIASVSSAAYAQTTPAPERSDESRIPQVFSQTITSGGYLGVQMKEVTKDNFAGFGLREVRGAAVEKILENSPAAQAGLQTGDVIVRFNNTEVTSVRQLTRLISEVAPDHQAKITISRGGSEREITATMGKRDATKMLQTGTLKDLYGYPGIPEFPELSKIPFPPNAPIPPLGDGESNVFIFGQSRQIGVGVAPLTAQLGDYFGVASGKGLLINNVRENSPASRAGLKAGDVIVEVEGKSVATNLELIRAIGEKKEGDVNLTIVRDKNRRTVRVSPEAAKSGTFNFNEDFPKLEGFVKPSKLAPAVPLAPLKPPVPPAPSRVL